MRPARLTVENALAAVDAGDGSRKWPCEAVGEQRLGRVAGTRRGDALALAANALELLGARRDHVRRQAADALDFVLAWLDVEAAARDRTVGMAHLQLERTLGVAPEADEKQSLRRDAHRSAAEAHLRAGLGESLEQSALDERAVETQLAGRRSRGRQPEDEDQNRSQHHGQVTPRTVVPVGPPPPCAAVIAPGGRRWRGARRP